MSEKDGPSCPGCGLPNYEGLCPHCSGDQDAYERELVPPFETSVPSDEELSDYGQNDWANYSGPIR
jgi:hypothetical protein